MTISSSTIITRGATALFSTTFYDAAGDVTQPSSATINIVYSDANGNQTTDSIAMNAPSPPATAWTAQWDTRGVGVGAASWSIHTGGSPYVVEDGEIVLTANNANLATF